MNLDAKMNVASYMQQRNGPTALFVTALPVESQAVAAHLQNIQETEHKAGTVYSVGTFEPERVSWNVALVEIGMGNARAAFETERAIGHFDPSHCFFVGVAGGLKDVIIGDVVAASKVYGYELGKAQEDFAPRPDFGSPAYPLVQRARAVARSQEWHHRIAGQSKGETGQHPRAIVAPIAAGEKVVASKQSAAYKLLKESFSDAVAIEMEGYGFFQAAQANHSVEAIAVRGISDLVEGKAEADASGSQELAAQHAAAFAFEVLANIKPPTNKSIVTNSHADGDAIEDDLLSHLASLAEKLYPEGPTHSQIWERSGGNLATLNLTGSGRSTWFGALRKLKMGGGGSNITPRSLVETMLLDYPSSEALSKIKHLLEAKNSNGLQ